MSGSQSKTDTQSSQNITSRNLNLQDSGGFTAADNKNSNITAVDITNTTDAGAVAAGTDVAKSALAAVLSAFIGGSSVVGNVASDALISNTNVANSGLNTAVDLGKGAFSLSTDVTQAAVDLGRQGVQTGAQLANAGLDNAAAAYQSGLTFGNNALNVVKDLASSYSLQNSQLTNNAISGFQSIAEQNSASDASQIQKVALYAIGAAVLLVVIPKVFGK